MAVLHNRSSSKCQSHCQHAGEIPLEAALSIPQFATCLQATDATTYYDKCSLIHCDHYLTGCVPPITRILTQGMSFIYLNKAIQCGVC